MVLFPPLSLPPPSPPTLCSNQIDQIHHYVFLFCRSLATFDCFFFQSIFFLFLKEKVYSFFNMASNPNRGRSRSSSQTTLHQGILLFALLRDPQLRRLAIAALPTGAGLPMPVPPGGCWFPSRSPSQVCRSHAIGCQSPRSSQSPAVGVSWAKAHRGVPLTCGDVCSVEAPRSRSWVLDRRSDLLLPAMERRFRQLKDSIAAQGQTFANVLAQSCHSGSR